MEATNDFETYNLCSWVSDPFDRYLDVLLATVLIIGLRVSVT